MHETIALKKGRSLIASFSLAQAKSRQWIVFLPESGSDFRDGSRSELKDLVGSRLAQKFNFLVINKPGVTIDKTHKLEFEKSFLREYRVNDAAVTLKKMIPKGDKIYLVGYSEGAYLAPQVAGLDKRVHAVVMIGGGTRGWLKEELSNATNKEKPEFKRRIKDIYKHPHSPKKWNGFSYATWYSYRGDNTLRALKQGKVPTLSILGARDRVIDLRSTIVDLMLVSERKPIQVHVFGDCGHHFTKHWMPVSRVLSRFLSEL
jgi:pimeloyl-ACP methyl ester carboxylesterase